MAGQEYTLAMIQNLIEKLKKQNWTFTFIGTDDLDVESIAMDMGIDNHLSFAEDEEGTKAMFANENRARERYNKCRAADCAMPLGSYFEEEYWKNKQKIWDYSYFFVVKFTS